jgi:hypothetical protein
MESRIPKFLLGGIQFRRNFLGRNTMNAFLWTVTECFLKAIVVVNLFSFGKSALSFSPRM